MRHYLHAQKAISEAARRSLMLSPRPRTKKHTSLIRADDDTAGLPTGRVFNGDRDGLPSLGCVDVELEPLEELELSNVGWWLVIGHGGPSLDAEDWSLESLSSADMSIRREGSRKYVYCVCGPRRTLLDFVHERRQGIKPSCFLDTILNRVAPVAPCAVQHQQGAHACGYGGRDRRHEGPCGSSTPRTAQRTSRHQTIGDDHVVAVTLDYDHVARHVAHARFGDRCCRRWIGC